MLPTTQVMAIVTLYDLYEELVKIYIRDINFPKSHKSKFYIVGMSCLTVLSMLILSTFMVFSVTLTICKRPKLGVWRFQSVMSTSCRYVSNFFKSKLIYNMTFRLAHWGT